VAPGLLHLAEGHFNATPLVGCPLSHLCVADGYTSVPQRRAARIAGQFGTEYLRVFVVSRDNAMTSAGSSTGKMQDMPLSQWFLAAAVQLLQRGIKGVVPQNWLGFGGPKYLRAKYRSLKIWVQENTMTDEEPNAPTDLVTNLELGFAYSPGQGRLWRVDGVGTPIRELTLWRWNEAEGRCRIKINTIWAAGKHRVLTHVIHYIMHQRWPMPAMWIDHIDCDPSNNAFANLREVTPTQNAMNTDRGGKRYHGIGEVLEQNVTRTRNGTYAVTVCGVYYGTFRSRTEANELARRMRREVKGEYDIPTLSWRRHFGPTTRC
jgi:hypothetical protein